MRHVQMSPLIGYYGAGRFCQHGGQMAEKKPGRHRLMCRDQIALKRPPWPLG